MTRHALPILAAALACVAPAARSDEPGAGPKPEARALFDGKSLDGWKKTDFYKTGTVAVEDGAIVLKPGEGPLTGITSTREDLPKVDYELTYEAMKRSGKDFFAAATFPVGDQYITLINGGWGGNVTGLSSINGSDASENETTTFVRYKDRAWHTFRVRVTAKAIRVWVDDREIAAVIHAERQVGTRIEVRSSQPLGFAAWNTEGAIRSVAVRPLTPAEVAATDAIEEPED